MANDRKPPIIIQPTSPPSDPSRAAAFVFVHGLGDEAEGVESAYIQHLGKPNIDHKVDIARQFQSAGKLPYT